MILFNLFFLLWTMLPKLESSLIYFFYLYTTIRPKYIVLFDLFFLLCMSIRSKIRVFIILFRLFVLENSIKTRNHSYFLIYSFQNCANILYAMFMVVLPLYFVHYIDASTALMFHTLQLWIYEVFVDSFTILDSV